MINSHGLVWCQASCTQKRKINQHAGDACQARMSR